MCQRVVRLHRRVARRRRGDPLQRVLHLGAPVEAFEILGEREQRLRAVLRLEQRRHGGHVDRRVAEAPDFEAEALQLEGAGEQCLVRRRSDIEQDRHEQALRLEPPGRQLLHHPFEQHALVRHMLIDDRHSLVVHGDDEGVAELAERDHRLDLDRCEVRGRDGRGGGTPLGTAKAVPCVRASRVRLALDARPSVRRMRAAGDRIFIRRALLERGRSRYPSIRVCSARQDTRERTRDRRPRHVLGTQLQLRRPAVAQCLHQRAPDDLVHQRLVAEADLRFRGMDVDVERVRRHPDEQMHLGTALLDRRLAVRIDDRVRDRPILDDAPVDEDVLRTTRRSLLGERRDEAGERHAARVLAQLHQVAALAVHLIQPVALRQCRRALQHLAARARQCEADLGIRQRELGDNPGDLRGLGGIGLQELAPRREVVEDVVDFDDGALRRADLDDRRDRAAVDANLGAALLPFRARAQHEVRHRRDRRQRLAAEPERQNGGQILHPPDLARGVALDREAGILRLHAIAIVLHADLFLAAQLDVDGQASRPRVDGVLDELLDDRSRAFDDLSSGDLVREVRRETADFAHWPSLSLRP